MPDRGGGMATACFEEVDGGHWQLVADQEHLDGCYPFARVLGLTGESLGPSVDDGQERRKLCGCLVFENTL